MRQRSARRHPWRSGAVGGLLVVVIASFAAWLISSDDASSGRQLIASGETVPSGTSKWSADPVRGAMYVDATLWTGTDVVLIGRSDAATSSPPRVLAFTPALGKWWSLSGPPVGQPLSGLGAVWTGRAVVVVGVRCNNTAGPEDEEPACEPGTLWSGLLDPATGMWTVVDPPPVEFDGRSSSTFGSAVGTIRGRAIFQIGAELWALDGTTWVRLPTRVSGSRLCISGDRIVALRSLNADAVVTDLRVDGGRFEVSYLDPGATQWTTLPETGSLVLLPNGVQMQCSDDSVLLATRGLDRVWLLDATDHWRTVTPPEHSMAVDPLPADLPAPLRAQSSIVNFTHYVWTGREFFWWQPRRAYEYGDGVQRPVWPGVGLTLDPVTFTWHSVEPGPDVSGEGASPQIAWSSGIGYHGVSGINNVGVEALSASPDAR